MSPMRRARSPSTAGDLACRLAACAVSAFDAALGVARAGVKVNAIGRAVEREVRRHGVGRTIHDEPSVPNWYDAWQTDVLTRGLALRIEPMISAGSPHTVQERDGWTLRTTDRSLSAHYEHTLVITDGAPIVLTAA